MRGSYLEEKVKIYQEEVKMSTWSTLSLLGIKVVSAKLL